MAEKQRYGRSLGFRNFAVFINPTSGDADYQSYLFSSRPDNHKLEKLYY